MALIPQHVPTDEFYPYDVLQSSRECLKALKKFPEWKDLEMHFFEILFRVFDDMENETPFSVTWHSSTPRIHLKENQKYEYRRPVWQIIFDTVNKNRPTQPFHNQKEAAVFLKEQLSLFGRNVKFEEWINKTRHELLMMGLAVSFSGNDELDVNISFGQEITGWNARVFLESFIKDLITKLEENEKK